MRLGRLAIVVAIAFGSALAVQAEERRLFMAAPSELVETGFLKHLLPRFSLKNSIPITLVAPGEPAQATFAPEGDVPVFAQEESLWFVALSPEAGDNPHLRKFLDWLGSDAGTRAIEGFAGPPVFSAAAVIQVGAEAEEISGDLARGAELSLRHCGRCHVIGPQNAMNGVGSTPSFAVLRTLENWHDRFTAFYALKPHPSFTQVEEITPPFPAGLQPTLAPVELTLDELADITAYAASLSPANLGAPIQHQ
ncbi:c-type cytochrome [Aliiruegeria lutimaris]|uniref:Cytochrome c n=1 Tax=Aliiruegeria lutimaris TaxID=571298 RepID=A0A1G9CZV9_9RHOB|nr:c-type cytochrome [Aliiruegeria lutimaris]SDK56925.1 Cytochrome c [Aliiruegeria lutimaris]